MGDLSPHFSRNEFACKCGCGRDTIDTQTLRVLERVRSHFNAPITINSAYRCSSHNAAVGGSPNSQHLYGRACDIVVQDVEPADVASYVESTLLEGKGGVGRYDTFTHVDTRSNGPSRWSG